MAHAAARALPVAEPRRRVFWISVALAVAFPVPLGLGTLGFRHRRYGALSELPKSGHHLREVVMLKSRFAKLGAAGFAAAAAVILIASSVWAHLGTAPSTPSSFNGRTRTTQAAETTVSADAAPDAEPLAADTHGQ